jgi:hypothetical protein
MSDYFILLDAEFFHGQLHPALSASRRARSFAPCRALCSSLLPAARSYAERYHTGSDEPLLARVAAGIAFDRTLWRALAGELLVFAAVDMPELQTNEETLTRLLAPHFDPNSLTSREALPPIVQAHRGSRDLAFGAVVYRPDHCGLNDMCDVVRLTDYLSEIRPETWTAEQLGGDADELEFAREWFPALVDLLAGARSKRCVIVHERMY